MNAVSATLKYSWTQQLKEHFKSAQENVCTQCDFKAVIQQSLKKIVNVSKHLFDYYLV